MTQSYLEKMKMTQSYLEEDVDDAAVAEEAHNEEDDVGNGSNVTYHGMLQRKSSSRYTGNILNIKTSFLLYFDFQRKVFSDLRRELAPVRIKNGHQVSRQSIEV